MLDRRSAVAFAVAVVACGPQVQVPGSDGGGTASGGGDESTTDASGDPGSSTSADSVADEESGATGICGDGTIDPGEACDDGNDGDADGCSHLCETSGTVSWSVDLTPEYGLAVGLDARDGEAYVLVQDYHDLSTQDVEAISNRVSALGELVGRYAHAQALADFDLAREAIAAVPGGEVIVGYPAPDFALGRIDLETGQEWSHAMSTWNLSYATRWAYDDVFTLRRAVSDIGEPGELAVVHFTDAGDEIETVWIETATADTGPLGMTPLFIRSPGRVVVLTAATNEPVEVHALAGGGWTVDEAGAPAVVQPRAFLHATGEIVIWTDTERVVVDVIDHVQPPEPRLVPGTVLTSFVGGFAIQTEQQIDVYDDAGTLRFSHVAEAVPHFAMPDGAGGLFVVSDRGVDFGDVILERLVL